MNDASLKASLHWSLELMAAVQQANVQVCDVRAHGWRQAIVDQRRELSAHLVTLTDTVRAAAAVADVDPVRRSLSNMRAALAEHQASWPAVSLDPQAPMYRRSIERVQTCFLALRAAVEALDERPPLG